MPVYSYRGVSKEGKEIKGLIEAGSERAAILSLKKKGIFPTELKEEKRKARKLSLFSSVPTGGELAIFFKTLATMLESGIPIIDAITSFADEADNRKLQLFFSKISESLKEGKGFKESLESAGLKDTVILSLILSGERSGLLPENLKIAASILERREELKSALITALIYPTVLITVAVGVVVFMMVTVIPKVVNIYASAKLKLPTSTKLVLFLSNLLLNYYWELLFLFFIFTASVFFVNRKFRIRVDRIKLRLPIVGKFLLFIELQRFLETLANLITSGVTFVDSLEIASLTVKNSYLRGRLQTVTEKVKRGESFSYTIFREVPMMPRVVYHLIKAGEESGKLAELMKKASLHLKTEFEFKLRNLTSLLEPATMLFVGLIIGFVIYALLLPIVSISTLKVL